MTSSITSFRPSCQADDTWLSRSEMQYVAIQKHWRRLGPLYRSPAAVPIWYLEMEAYRAQRAAEYGRAYRPASLSPELVPANYESCDWRVTRGRRGPEPAFWAYVCYSACHWVCNLHLWVAMQDQPERPWRIVTRVGRQQSRNGSLYRHEPENELNQCHGTSRRSRPARHPEHRCPAVDAFPDGRGGAADAGSPRR
jgi:alkanesulfonate monooxygenase SsuD/methylene tetrahydromethanopterin reductase-like flavin-dependent oxidoreductase (luciferase family)